METELITLCSLALSLAAISVLAYLLAAKMNSSSKRRLPPGPTPLPIVGSLFELGDKPHRSLTRLAKSYGPVMMLKLGSRTTVVISSAEAAREVLQTKDQSLSSRAVPAAVQSLGDHNVSVLWLDPSPSWKNLRTILKSHLFTPQSLDANQAIRHRKVQELVAHVRRHMGRKVDIGRAAFGTALNVISNMFFSIDLVELGSDHGQEFRDLVSAIMQKVGSPNLSDFFPLLRGMDLQGHGRAATKYLKKLHELLDQVIDSRLQDRSNSTTDRDFLDTLLRLQDQQSESNSKIDRRIIRSLFTDMFIAGTDTTSTTMEWIMAELLRNPSSLKRARAEIAEVVGPGREVEESDIARLPFLQAVVKETFRLRAGPFLLPHRCQTSVEVGGYTVPKDCRIWINLWALGRDEEAWTEPESFMPERFLGTDVDFRGRHFGLIPFGSGRRQCPGLPLAHRMLHLMLASLLHSFEWGLPDGMGPKDVDITEKFGVSLQFAVPLPAIPLPVKY